MAASVVSGSQRRPIMDFMRSLSGEGQSSQSKSQRRQDSMPLEHTSMYARPEGRASKNTRKSLKRSRSQRPSDAAFRRNEQHISAGSVGRRTNAGTGTAHKDCEGSAVSKPHSSLACVTVNTEGRERNASRRPRDKPWSTKTDTLPFITNAFPCNKRGAHEIDQPIAGMSVTGRATPGSIRDDSSHLQTMRREEREISTPVRYPDGDQPKSQDIKVAGQSSTGFREIEKLRRDLSISHSRIAELEKRCDAQSRDQDAANSFFNITDKSSDSDVLRALQRLNAEVQQTATYMADCLAQDFEFKNVATDVAEEQIPTVQKVSCHIGLVLAKALGSKTLEIPLLLQIAFQAYLATVLGQTASAWALDTGYNSFIDSIYQKLRGVEAQATSGRWRSLARYHNHHNWVTQPEALVERLIAGLSDILLVAGCTAPQSNIIFKITSMFKEKIALLVELAVRLNKILDEVISSDFEVLLVQPGDNFEGKNMEETDGNEDGIQEASTVLCATHLGLIKQAPEGTLWEKGQKQKMMVLKAKVLLESFLDTEDE